MSLTSSQVNFVSNIIYCFQNVPLVSTGRTAPWSVTAATVLEHVALASDVQIAILVGWGSSASQTLMSVMRTRVALPLLYVCSVTTFFYIADTILTRSQSRSERIVAQILNNNKLCIDLSRYVVVCYY